MRDAVRFLGEHCPVPIHCIPNAGIPHQGPDGETIFPAEPEPLADVLGDFVERYGLGIVGGCCGTTTEHIRAIKERCTPNQPKARPAPRPIHVSSMMTATPLVQEPAPTIVGERVNSQGSRKAKEMLLADDYEGLLTIAEDQVEGGAHVLDLCVALTERQDEDEQMRLVAKKVALTQPAPIQVDSTEPEVIETALDQIPGRAIVNSVNLEAGRDKLDRVVPVVKAHGAALIALTIDEVGMAKTRERKLEIAQRLKELVCDEHGLEPEALIFDALTFTLTTGDDEWKPSAVETIEGIRLIKSELPGVKTSLGVSNVSFGIGVPARSVLNSVFLHHCVEAGLDLAMVNPNHITPYGEIPDAERKLADDLVFNRSDEALQHFIEHFEAKSGEAEAEVADPTAGMNPQEALHWHILRRKKDGVEDQIDASVEDIGAVPTLNDVLLPAMKEVGDKFGAGELILPFVLQSAEVMKKAVARLENYLDKLEGYTKGTVVLATVFGDVHDIGKSLVNTILTNNGYTVIDLGKQVPIGTILDAAEEHKATAIGLSALLVSTSKQMPLAIAELHERGLEFPVLIGGAAINRKFGLRANYPKGKDSEDVYEPGVFYCKDAFEGLGVMDKIVEPEAREQLVTKTREAASTLRETGEEEEVLDTTDDSVRSPAKLDVPVPTPPFWGVRELEVDLDEVYPHLDTHVLFKLHWGGRGVKGEEWRKLVTEDFRPRLERMWREQTYLHPRALLGYFPCYSEGNEIVVLDPEDRETVLERLATPRQPENDRIALADFFRPKDAGELDVDRAAGRHGRQRGHRGDGEARAGRRVRRAALHPRHRRADGRGHGRVAALEDPRGPRHPADPGPPLLVGLPRRARAVRARQGRPPARPLDHRHQAVGRPRGRARAVHARADRAPPAGRLLRHAQRPAAPRGLARRRHQGHRPRPVAVRRHRLNAPEALGAHRARRLEPRGDRRGDPDHARDDEQSGDRPRAARLREQPRRHQRHHAAAEDRPGLAPDRDAAVAHAGRKHSEK